MKWTTVVLSGMMILSSTIALADTFNHNFWSPHQGQTFDSMTPKKGTGLISTDFSYAHREFTDGNGTLRKKNLNEYVTYGLTDRLTAYGEISRDWNRYSVDNMAIHSKMDYWFLGTGYRFIDDGKNILNAMVSYGQKDDSIEGMLKGYSIYGVYGHNFDTFSPHVFLGWNQFVNQGKKNDEEWYCYVGTGIPLSKTLSAELGVDYDRQASAFKTWGGYTSLSYVFNDFLTTELYSQYVLGSSVKYNSNNYKIDNSYTVGLRITTMF